MKIIHFDPKKGAKLRIVSPEDLWTLRRIIEPGDIVYGVVFRKVKIGGEEERARVARERFYVGIKVDKVEYLADRIRLIGEIVESEQLPRGATQSIEFGIGDEIRIEKTWPLYQQKLLHEAEKLSRIPKLLVCVLDDEQANIGLFTFEQIRKLARVELGLAKKRYEKKELGALKKLAKKIIQFFDEYNCESLLLASPLFWKDKLFEQIIQIKPELKEKVILESVSTGSERAFTELLGKDLLKNILKYSRALKEHRLIEKFTALLATNGPVAYGFTEVREAAEQGAIDTLLITERAIMDAREKGEYDEIERLIKAVESTRGEVHILSSELEPGQKLDGLGGFGAILRWKIR